MYTLARTVRFCIPFCPGPPPEARHNTFAAWPAMTSLGAYYELTVCCRGLPEPRTGYLQSITAVDETVRNRALPAVRAAAWSGKAADPARVLRDLLAPVADGLGTDLHSISWRLTPTYSVTMHAEQPDRVEIAQQFEFAAAHRLHVASMTADENRRVFGKCNNPEGHGHNYRLEVAVRVPVPTADDPSPLADLERVVDEVVIRRFDHRHLNRDTAEFAELNPSVEHITRTCHDLLAGPLSAIGAELARVTVWETAKTSCTYPAP